jgi:hypothetical protein
MPVHLQTVDEREWIGGRRCCLIFFRYFGQLRLTKLFEFRYSSGQQERGHGAV